MDIDEYVVDIANNEGLAEGLEKLMVALQFTCVPCKSSEYGYKG
jgi:hypothetical protein